MATHLLFKYSFHTARQDSERENTFITKKNAGKVFYENVIWMLKEKKKCTLLMAQDFVTIWPCHFDWIGKGFDFIQLIMIQCGQHQKNDLKTIRNWEHLFLSFTFLYLCTQWLAKRTYRPNYNAVNYKTAPMAKVKEEEKK